MQAARGFVCLIAESSPLVALVLEETFENAGHRVAGPFTTRMSALKWLDGNKPDVAVIETDLHDGSALDLAVRLKRLRVPIVVFSAGDTHGVEDRPELAGLKWVQKPSQFRRRTPRRTVPAERCLKISLLPRRPPIRAMGPFPLPRKRAGQDPRSACPKI